MCGALQTLPAFGWGALGHRLVAEYGAKLALPTALSQCQLTKELLIEHTNDPDKIWRNKPMSYPHEAQAHYFQVDKQPKDWRNRKEPFNRSDGFLVYRIIDWFEDVKKLKKLKNWDALKEKIYGVTHYLGDLTQPLHLHQDHDGQNAGLPDLHAQFETKMLNRYEEDVRVGIQQRLSQEKIPIFWKQLDFKTLVFNIAEQSFAKADSLFIKSKPALVFPKRKNKKPRFMKAILWKNTGSLAADQLSLATRLVAHFLNEACKD